VRYLVRQERLQEPFAPLVAYDLLLVIFNGAVYPWILARGAYKIFVRPVKIYFYPVIPAPKIIVLRIREVRGYFIVIFFCEGKRLPGEFLISGVINKEVLALYYLPVPGGGNPAEQDKICDKTKKRVLFY